MCSDTLLVDKCVITMMVRYISSCVHIGDAFLHHLMYLSRESEAKSRMIDVVSLSDLHDRSRPESCLRRVASLTFSLNRTSLFLYLEHIPFSFSLLDTRPSLSLPPIHRRHINRQQSSLPRPQQLRVCSSPSHSVLFSMDSGSSSSCLRFSIILRVRMHA
jgi:hypothetical protein